MKWYKVTAYYPLTQISSGIHATDEHDAHDQAVELFADIWGDNARQFEHIEIEEQ